MNPYLCVHGPGGRGKVSKINRGEHGSSLEDRRLLKNYLAGRRGMGSDPVGPL